MTLDEDKFIYSELKLIIEIAQNPWWTADANSYIALIKCCLIGQNHIMKHK